MLIIDRHSDEPLYMQIYLQLRDKIISGELCEGSILPPIRTLASTLLVAKNTVDSAYQQLCSEGYVQSKVGSGYKVQKIAINNLAPSHIKQTDFEKPITQESEETYPVQYDFKYCRLDIENFPLRIWRKLLNQVLLSDEIGHIAD